MLNSKHVLTPIEHTIQIQTGSFRTDLLSILYLYTSTRPYLSASTSILDFKVSSPTALYEIGVPRLMKYLNVTKYAKLCLQPGTSDQLPVHLYYNWASNQEC